MMNKLLIPAVLAAVCGAALAKIPVPVLDDAAKLKAAEAAAKTAWSGKVDAWLLCKSQDKVAAQYRKTAGKPAAETKPAAPAAAAAATTPAAGGTPVAAAPAVIPPCADPGPFAFTPPEQKPIEASGAHSQPGNATSPPSTTTPAANMAPAKKS